jgi:hypothetical protein
MLIALGLRAAMPLFLGSVVLACSQVDALSSHWWVGCAVFGFGPEGAWGLGQRAWSVSVIRSHIAERVQNQ